MTDKKVLSLDKYRKNKEKEFIKKTFGDSGDLNDILDSKLKEDTLEQLGIPNLEEVLQTPSGCGYLNPEEPFTFRQTDYTKSVQKELENVIKKEDGSDYEFKVVLLESSLNNKIEQKIQNSSFYVFYAVGYDFDALFVPDVSGDNRFLVIDEGKIDKIPNFVNLVQWSFDYSSILLNPDIEDHAKVDYILNLRQETLNKED